MFAVYVILQYLRISLLDHLHTLRMCEAFLDDAQDAAMEEHNSSYYVKLARVVCGNLDGKYSR